MNYSTLEGYLVGIHIIVLGGVVLNTSAVVYHHNYDTFNIYDSKADGFYFSVHINFI